MRILACDPAMANFGMAKFDLEIASLDLTLLKLRLVQTEKATGKVVRQNSDDLRRAIDISDAFHEEVKDCDYVFAEIPSGAQSARASYGFGMQVGILATSPAPIIQVMPSETKMAAVGKKTASKAEIITWASELYPKAEWIRVRGKPTGKLVNDNEHLADACAIAHAGLLTDEFRRLRTMLVRAAA